MWVENNHEEEAKSWNKRRRRIKAMDRLSALPDEILILILSGFDDVAHAAAATCLLSKRWQLLWSKLPRFDFSEHSRNPKKTRNFVSWVNRAIACRSRSYDALERFSVSFFYHESYSFDVCDWIRFAVRNDVKDLCLDLWSERDCLYYTPPEELYSHSSFTRMSLARCVLAPQGKIEWPRLTRLSVCCVELTQRVVENILSGCPVLRDLSLTACWGFDRIDSESLRTLTVSYDDDDGNYCMEDSLGISAPGLSSLNVSFSPVNKKLMLTNVGSTSLDSVKIEYTSLDNSEELMSSTMELLEKTRHAKRLVLVGYFLQVVSKMLTYGRQLPQSTRKQLTIETWRHKKMIPGILCMLGSSPTLQTLLIEWANHYEMKSAMTWGPTAINRDLDCDLLNLKTVRLLYYAYPEFDGEPMMRIARILLKRATSLKEMVIRIEDLTPFSTNYNEMSQALLDYTKSSVKALVSFSSVNERCFNKFYNLKSL